LAPRPRIPNAIRYILETREVELRRLLDQTPYSCTSQEYEKRVFNPNDSCGDATNQAE
jgi:hypothetical protein